MPAPVTTYLVLPAGPALIPGPGEAQHLRVVSRRANVPLALTDYRHNPDGWAEVGLVRGYEGTVLCLDAPVSVWADLESCVPIRPPLVVYHRDEALG